MTQDMIDTILDMHNTYRSQVALGRVDGSFGKAVRMTTIKWDQNLADLAEISAKKCKKQHSQCHNTPEFKQAGQNIAIQSSSTDFMDDTETVKKFLEKWFNEYKLTDDSMIKSAPGAGG
jgi:Cysteine-rich secretory protein family